jgi:hypothetical protein
MRGHEAVNLIAEMYRAKGLKNLPIMLNFTGNVLDQDVELYLKVSHITFKM